MIKLEGRYLVPTLFQKCFKNYNTHDYLNTKSDIIHNQSHESSLENSDYIFYICTLFFEPYIH